MQTIYSARSTDVGKTHEIEPNNPFTQAVDAIEKRPLLRRVFTTGMLFTGGTTFVSAWILEGQESKINKEVLTRPVLSLNTEERYAIVAQRESMLREAYRRRNMWRRVFKVSAPLFILTLFPTLTLWLRETKR